MHYWIIKLLNVSSNGVGTMSEPGYAFEFRQNQANEDSDLEQLLDPDTSLYNTTRKGIVSAKSPGDALSKVDKALKKAQRVADAPENYRIANPTVKNEEASGTWKKNSSKRGYVNVYEQSRSDREGVYKVKIELTNSNSTRRKRLKDAMRLLE